MVKNNKIKIAVVGVGNCFSSLYQGFSYYKKNNSEDVSGIMFRDIGGYLPTDIEVVAAFDVDDRKVGKPVGKAIFSEPNVARIFYPNVPKGPIVSMGNVLDGVSDYMKNQPAKYGFCVSKQKSDDIIKILKKLRLTF